MFDNMVLRSLYSMINIGEKEVFEKLLRVCDMAISVNEVLCKMMLEKEVTNIETSYQYIKKIEKEADLMNTELLQKINGGAMSPVTLNSLNKLVNLSDTIIDLSFNISRELYRFSKVLDKYDERSINDIYKRLEDIMNINRSSLTVLKHLFKAKKLNEITSDVDQIIKYEEIVDDIKDEIIDELYKRSKDIDYFLFHHLDELTQKLDDVLDVERDIAELSKSMILSIM